MSIDLERRPGEELNNGIHEHESSACVRTRDSTDGELYSVDKVDVNANVNMNYCVNDSASAIASEGNENVHLDPREGMEFESHEEAFSFYKEYARREGFGVSKRNSRRSRISKKFIDAKFACCRYGTKQASDRVSRPRPTAKIDCKAAMHVKRKVDGAWYVYSFVKEHNHELSRDHAHFFRCHRDTNPNKDKIRTTPTVGVRLNEVCPSLPASFHGFQNDNCFVQGIKNDLGNGPWLALEVGDAQALNEFFLHMQEENPNFFYALDLNRNQNLRNVFWVDAKGRHDYIDFSDVISFDSIYATNGYKVPIAPFIGVNHHGHFILFGCAILADMNKSSFVWLFKTWLRAMGGQAPKVIVTEQGNSMSEAVEEVFPNSRHCYCLWDITRKIPDKLTHVIKRDENFMVKFNKCIYKSWTKVDFERRWWKMVNRFELREDCWIQSLYEDRQKWVPIYLNDTFLAGMSTSQRSESINFFFDRYVTKVTTLKEFVEQYEVALHDRCEKEAHADFESRQTVLPLKSPSPYEKQMSSIYTREIFKKFQYEVMGAHACHPVKETEDDETVSFRVTDLERQQEFRVVWNGTKLVVSCSCLSFGLRGFLCRHAMIVLQFSGVFSIPTSYILKRWTKDAKNRHILNQISNPVESRGQRYNDLCRRAIRLAEEGSLSLESYNVALLVLEEGINKCVAENDSLSSAGKPRLLTAYDLQNTADKEADSIRRKVGSKRIQSRTEKTNRKRPNEKINIGVDENVASVGMSETLQVMGQQESRTTMVDSYYGTQGSLQAMGQWGSKAPVVNTNSCYATQDNLQEMGQWESRAPIGSYYGTSGDKATKHRYILHHARQLKRNEEQVITWRKI
ncbi:protein FAR1-RELATED SEQUENCE 4-like isoform X2 [Papaver somniferum]|uniref:protein FAR1-RELATED SEQUENCE 4-like isoform X2 n=1 Tax=Papaver somniferum TaxID=3469 RepID=UPI000E702A70|nr:protein FAR1-RELATED SEQUENCE 4-like isoform X2 [Papaver somniferum]